VSLLALFLAWWAMAAANAAYLKWFNPVLLPAPPAIGKEAWRLLVLGSLQWDVLTSLARVAQGFVIAAILGVVAGTLVARVTVIENLVEPVLDVLRPIPPLAFLPLLVLYLGIGEASKIGFIAYSAFFPIFTTTREGIKYVDPLLVRAAESLGASERDILRYVIIPAAMPSIMTGLRLSFALSFFVIVASTTPGSSFAWIACSWARPPSACWATSSTNCSAGSNERWSRGRAERSFGHDRS
jgi:ABC-type nitrate/sulfonate/bicarbonate transport system permease component